MYIKNVLSCFHLNSDLSVTWKCILLVCVVFLSFIYLFCLFTVSLFVGPMHTLLVGEQCRFYQRFLLPTDAEENCF